MAEELRLRSHQSAQPGQGPGPKHEQNSCTTRVGQSSAFLRGAPRPNLAFKLLQSFVIATGSLNPGDKAMNVKPSSTKRAATQTAPPALAPRARRAHLIMLGLLMAILSGRLLPRTAHAGHMGFGRDSAQASAPSQTGGFAHRRSASRKTPKSASVLASRNAEKMPVSIARADILVPEPATAVLLVSGALATVGFPLVLTFRRRKRRLLLLARAGPGAGGIAGQGFSLFSACPRPDSVFSSNQR